MLRRHRRLLRAAVLALSAGVSAAQKRGDGRDGGQRGQRDLQR